MVRLFSYKLTSDTGFAPNPFWGYLTLATCKPGIRGSKKTGDWIAGFTSKELNGDEVGKEKLIYLMKVEEKLTTAEYFSDKRFRKKIPKIKHRNCIYKTGDNIYRPIVNNPTSPKHFEQIKNVNHNKRNIKRDLSKMFVLSAREYYYFGKDALSFGNKSNNIPLKYRPKTPTGPSLNGVLTRDEEKVFEFINYIQNNYCIGVKANPHKWPKSNDGCRRK